MASGFAGKHLLAADYWGGAAAAVRGTENPPPEGRSLSQRRGRLHARPFCAVRHHLPPTGGSWRGTVRRWQELSTRATRVRASRAITSAPTRPARRVPNSPSRLFDLMVWIPVPTKFVKVEATAFLRGSGGFFFDRRTLDSAMAEKEQVKTLFRAPLHRAG